MYKKVNIKALCEAVVWQNPLLYLNTTADQYKSIVNITTGSFDFNVKDIIGISMRLTGRWDGVTVSGPAVTDMTYMRIRLIVSICNLLPEFIVEGEEWTAEEPDNHDGHE